MAIQRYVQVTCDMTDDCATAVSMLDEKGYVYCAEHGLARRDYGLRCRKLRPHELRRIERGEQIARY